MFIEQAANPQRAIQDFADIAFQAMSAPHHQDFMHLQADPDRGRRPLEFFAHQQLGVAMMDPRAFAAVDFS